MNVRNHTHLIGNLGDDPKTVTLASGTTVTEFSLATSDTYRDKDGNRQTRTEWHRVKAFGKLAEIWDKHLAKGVQVAVTGELRYNKWVDKYDQKRSSVEVIASDFTFLGGGKDKANAAPKNTDPVTSQSSKQPVTAEASEDLPF